MDRRKFNKGRPRKEPWADFWLGAMPDPELAALIGLHRESVRTRRRRAGIDAAGYQLGSKWILAQQQNEMVRSLLVKHQRLATVGRIMGVTRQRIYQIAERAGCRRVWIA